MKTLLLLAAASATLMACENETIVGGRTEVVAPDAAKK